MTMEKKPIRKKPPNLHIFWLSFLFFAAAILMFVVSMVVGIRWIPDLITHGNFRGAIGWTLTHMLLLGWVSMLAMGANYQLVQIIFNARLFSRTLGFVHFGFYFLGLIVSLAGFYRGDSSVIAAGGASIAAGVILFVLNMTITIVRKRKYNVFFYGIFASLLNLVFVVVLGVLQGVSAKTGWGIHHYDHLFRSHLWLGLAGWMAGLIITYSFKLLPMFYVSRKKPTSDVYWIIGLFHGGVWLKVGGIWLEWTFAEQIGLIEVMLSAILLTRFVASVQINGKSPGGAIPVAAHMVPAASVGLWLWGGFVLFLPDSSSLDHLTTAYILFLVCGWFSVTTLSYLSKIIPFLWWAHRFHTKWKKKSAVLLSEMTPDKSLIVYLSIYMAGISLVTVALLYDLSGLAIIGQMMAVLAAVVYIIEMARVFRY